MSWVLEPLDHLLQTVQSLSANHDPLLHFLRGLSPLSSTMELYQEMISQPMNHGRLAILHWYYDGRRDDNWADTEQVAKDLFTDCGCCLHAGFSLKVFVANSYREGQLLQKSVRVCWMS